MTFNPNYGELARLLNCNNADKASLDQLLEQYV